MVVITNVIFLLVCVEAMVCCFVEFTPVSTARQSRFLPTPFLALSLIEKIDDRKVKNFSFFVFR